MMHYIRTIFAAIGFLTRIPVPFFAANAEEATADLRRAIVLFPLVGVGIGTLTTAVIVFGSYFWPWWLAVIIGLAVEAVLTGAFHEDAVADFCDAFGGGWTRDDVLRILKDSRIGSFGAVGLLCALAIRCGGMIPLEQANIWLILPLSAGFGRWVILGMMIIIEPIGHREGLAKDVAGRAAWWQACLGGLFISPWIVVYANQEPMRFAVALGLAAVFCGWFRWYLQRRLGGITGDCLGFSCYVGQLIFLLVAVARGPNG